MKENKGRKTPNKFFFECELVHGRYPVTEKTMMQFIKQTPHFNEAKERLKSGARGVILKFHNGCPRCASMNESAEVTVEIIKPPH